MAAYFPAVFRLPKGLWGFAWGKPLEMGIYKGICDHMMCAIVTIVGSWTIYPDGWSSTHEGPLICSNM